MTERQITTRPDQSKSGASEKVGSLNFKVSADFKKAFKGYAVAQGMTMVELLREGFEFSKASRSR